MLSHYLRNHIGQFWNDVICEQPLRHMSYLNLILQLLSLSACFLSPWLVSVIMSWLEIICSCNTGSWVCRVVSSSDNIGRWQCHIGWHSECSSRSSSYMSLSSNIRFFVLRENLGQATFGLLRNGIICGGASRLCFRTRTLRGRFWKLSFFIQ